MLGGVNLRGGTVVTIWDVIGLASRLWLVTLMGLALTAAGMALAWDQPGVYSGQVNVVLLSPHGPTGNALVDTTSSLVVTSGLVTRVIEGEMSASGGTVSTTVPLASDGAALGYSVRQVNVGGQWEPHYADPVLDVQSTGPTQVAAEAQMGEALAKVHGALDLLENRAGVAPGEWILVQLSPGQPVYMHATGSRTRAIGATLLVGAMVTIGALLATVEARRRRQPSVTAGTTRSDVLHPA